MRQPIRHIVMFPVSTPSGCHGVSLIELLVAVAIVAVLGAIGVPAFGQFRADQQVEAQRDALVQAVSTARVEAQRRAIPVMLCPSSTGQRCGGVDDWSKGWIVYVDNDRSQSFSAEADTLLLSQLIANAVRINSAVNALRWLPSGMGSAADFSFCSQRQPTANRQLTLNPLGAISEQGQSNANCVS